jgi:hypothetical protein
MRLAARLRRPPRTLSRALRCRLLRRSKNKTEILNKYCYR